MNDTDLPLPDLDKLHAEATPAPWSRCECGKCGLVWSDPAQTTVLQGAARRMVTALCGEDNDDCPPVTPEQQQANGELIVALVNTWPTISARLKELEADNKRLKRERFKGRAIEADKGLETGFLAGNPWAPRIKELESALAQLHEAVGRGPGHGTVKETLACAISGICDLRQSEQETAEENKALETRNELLEETLRGILQEKRTRSEQGTSPVLRAELERQIAWLESVLGGGK